MLYEGYHLAKFCCSPGGAERGALRAREPHLTPCQTTSNGCHAGCADLLCAQPREEVEVHEKRGLQSCSVPGVSCKDTHRRGNFEKGLCAVASPA
ncbi:hypothetical protein WJX75_000469 [Coccomyxa subellipsoidea]